MEKELSVEMDKEEKTMKRNGWKVACAICVAALLVVGVFSVYQARTIDDYENSLNGTYTRAFSELVEYVENVDTMLVKTMVTASPAKTTNFLEETWRYATLAETHLSELPLSQSVVSDLSKFLVQVGDYAYALAAQSAKGTPLTEEQYETLQQLETYALELNVALRSILQDFSDGNLNWDTLKNAGDEVEGLSVESLSKTFAEYPTLIYDGPFSDHIPQTEPKGLTGQEITKEEAQQKAEAFFGKENVEAVTFLQETAEEQINVYSFQVTCKEGETTGYIDITKQGGHVYWAICSREIGVSTLDVEQAIEKAEDFLEQQGYDDMTDSYYTNENGMATINFIYEEDDIRYYPDMIKVKVALDNGEILGLETKSYLYNHTKREAPQKQLSLEEAKKKISSHLQVQASGLAVIPTEFQTEVLVYEFQGTLEGKNLLVYINAQTGEEEDVLIILDTDSGILTE